MSWLPGTGPVKDISAVGVSRGLSEGWYSDTGSKKEISKGNFWDIIDNPLYQVAAEAKGYDWATWVKEAKGKVGTGPKDGTRRVRAVIKPGTPGTPATTRRGGMRNNERVNVPATAGTPAEYEWMTIDEAKDRGLDYEAAKTSRWRNKKTGKIHESKIDPNKARRQTPTGGTGYASHTARFGKINKDWEDDWEELRDWGVHDEGVAKDLDEISGWLNDIVSVNDHIPKLIREGPQGHHYGIEGDIWEHYGLDKEPEPPKELEWDSAEKDMVLNKAVRSSVTYSTPGDLTPVDLHSD